MSNPIRITRALDGNVHEAIFSNTQVPIASVHEKIGQPIPCLLQSRDTAKLPKTQRRYEPGEFFLRPDGSIIEATADVSRHAMVGPRVVFHSGVKVEAATVYPGVELERGVTVSDDAELHNGVLVRKGTEIGRGTRVGARGSIGEMGRILLSTLGPNCTIGDGAYISRTSVKGSLQAGDGLHLTKATIFSKVRLGEDFYAEESLTLRDGVRFGDHALVGKNVRVAPGVIAGAFCALEDGVTIDDGVVFGKYVEVGAQSRVDVGAVLEENTILGARVYVGPHVEVTGRITDGTHLAYKRSKMPVWPIPTRTFEAMLAE